MSNRITCESLLALYEYNIYANQIILDAAAQLDETALKHESDVSHGSAWQLLRHMLGGEDYLYALCQPQRVPEKAEFHTVADLRAFYERVAARNKVFLAGLEDPCLDQDVTMTIAGQPREFAMWHILTQSLFHSIHHRGELSILFTQAGRPLPDMDIIVYFMQ